jgi:branched-chain amino acid transport system ATP-binding protein
VLVLSVENLKVRYRNGALGILDVTFSVEAGQVIALFGPNGAGKTTSVRAVSGFMKTEGAKLVAGKVTLFGEDMTNAEPHRTSIMGVAFVPERRKVFSSLSVSENLAALGKRPPRARRAEVYDRVYTLFPVLAERRRELAGRLSGGQQQMLAIGRSLIGEPKLLIVDEMTLGLHHSMHPPLFEAVKSIAAQGTAVVVVDESTGFALEVADHCYLLGGGTVRDDGPAERFRGNELLAAGYVEAS